MFSSLIIYFSSIQNRDDFVNVKENFGQWLNLVNKIILEIDVSYIDILMIYNASEGQYNSFCVK